jgi:hypothetical protein
LSSGWFSIWVTSSDISALSLSNAMESAFPD